MATQRGRLILTVLAVVVIASLWRTVLVERDKRRLSDAYRQTQELVKQMETERSHLNEELGSARQTIETQSGSLQSLQHDLQDVQGKLEKTTAELASLQREHEQLRTQNSSLATKLDSVLTEKQQLEAKLSSLKELRLAIRDVQRKMWNERLAAWRARVQALKQTDQERLALGNRGFLVRDGKPTLGTATTLRVHVLEPQAQ